MRIHRLSNLVSYLCEIAGVSRSGYYAWLSARSNRDKRCQKDWKDYELIKKVFDRSAKKQEPSKLR